MAHRTVTMTRPTTVRTSAPVRLDFAGGWTDVAPFAVEARGVVVNAAIALRTRVELRLEQQRYELWSEDLDERADAPTAAAFRADGRLGILKAAVRTSGIGPCSIRTAAQAPPGSGLGSSGALGVALVHALGVAQGHDRSRGEVAEEAWRLETVDAGVPGGKQDQYAAANGGFQQLRFAKGNTTAHPLKINPGFADDLARHIVLCYTGKSRFSGDTISRVMTAYSKRDPAIVGALHAMADLAEEMALALGAADTARVARLLTANWHEQQRLDRSMCTDEMRRLEAAMLDAGALGWKAAGAGAGGSMFFLVPGDVTAAIVAARQSGTQVLPVRWDLRGLGQD
jgi:D-glycero-alpha-D-manno-heptose-7-phosphate kinase